MNMSLFKYSFKQERLDTKMTAKWVKCVTGGFSPAHQFPNKHPRLDINCKLLAY